MSCEILKDQQKLVHLSLNDGEYHFQDQDRDWTCSTLTDVHRFFYKKGGCDTVVFRCDGKKSYVHFSIEGIEVYKNRKTLREALGRETGGAWCEEKEGEKRYFVGERGWFGISIKEVFKEECFIKKSTLQKTLGIGLGILSLCPGAFEIAQKMPFGVNEMAIGAFALNQKSLLLGSLLLPSFGRAQMMGPEFQVNNYTISDQQNPDIASLADGGAIVVWQSDGQDGDSRGVYAQRYNATGDPVGGEFRVNTITESAQTNPSVAGLQNGGFVVAWHGNGDSGPGIYAQRFASDGMMVANEFLVNTYRMSTVTVPDVAALRSGGFVVVWKSEGQDGDLGGIYGQVFDIDGGAAGSEFQVNTAIINAQEDAEVTGLENGNFIVTWQSDGQDGGSFGIYGQEFTDQGLPVDGEFQINTQTASAQKDPVVTGLLDRSFVVVWQSSEQDGDGFGIYSQRFSPDRTFLGVETPVNDYTLGPQKDSAIATLTTGNYLIAWQSLGQDGSEEGIYAKLFRSDGDQVSSEFLVNNYTISSQEHPSVAALQNGTFMVVWQSLGQDGDGYGIFGRVAIESPLSSIMSLTTERTSSSSSTESSSRSLSAQGISSTFNSSSQLFPFSSETNSVFSFLSSTSTVIPTSGSRTVAAEESSTMTFSSSTMSTTQTIIEFSYSESYPLVVNGQTVGTFTFSGGSGLIDPSNPNTITIDFDSGFTPEDGDVITLFTFAADQAGQWDNLIVEAENLECFEARTEVGTGTTSSSVDYQLIFEQADSCVTAAICFGANFIPIALQ